MKKAILLLSIVFSFPGCAAISPLVQEFNIISIPEERKIGVKLAEQIAQEMPLSQDASQNKRLAQVATRLVDALPRRDFDYGFFVVKDDTPNAFTIPGGFIYVHTGLLNFVSDDDELAGVLAHELGHAYLRHPAKGLSRNVGVDYLYGLIFGPTTAGKESALKSLAMQLAKGGLLTKYGRQDERESDDFAYYFLKRASYKTNGLLRFLTKLQQLQRRGSSSPLDFLSSHPPTPERVARLQQLEQTGGAITQAPAQARGLY